MVAARFYRGPATELACVETYGECHLAPQATCETDCPEGELCTWMEDCSAGHCVDMAALLPDSLDAGTITVTGASLGMGGTCTIRVSLTVPVAAAANVYTNTTSDVTGMIGGFAVSGDAASDDLEVVDLLSFSKSFDGLTTAGGASSSLGGSGTGLLTFTGGELPPMGGTCSFQVEVTVPSMAAAPQAHAAMATFLGDEELGRDPRFASMSECYFNHEAMTQRIRAGIRDRKRSELFDLATSLGIVGGPVSTPEEVPEIPQLAARGFWRGVELSSGGSLRVPGCPLRPRTHPRVREQRPSRPAADGARRRTWYPRW